MTGVTSDAELLEQWRAGDEAAGRRIVDAHFEPLYRFFRSKVGDDADDLVQETLLAILKNRVPFRGEATFRSYVFRVARSLLYDRARSWHRKDVHHVDVSVHSIAELRASPMTELGQRQEERLLLRALRALPIEQQVLLSLFYFEELTGPELASIFDVAEGTVRSRIRLAKDALRDQIERAANTLSLASSTVTRLDDWLASLRGQLGKKD